MIVVTGGAGFIGSNIVRALNRNGIVDILVVDNLSNAAKVANLSKLVIRDYMDKYEFLGAIQSGRSFDRITTVFHQGACSDTMATDGKYVLQNNFTFSKTLFHFCQRHKAQFIYASSASVYGSGSGFSEDRSNESALNVYAWSKLLFDNYIRQSGNHPTSPGSPEISGIQCVGLRYFNVYGPGEFHKGRMASVAWHFNNQYREKQTVNLFAGTDGYRNGEQLRDFIHVDDVVDVNLYFMNHPELSGIYNVGTGRAQSFNQVALAVINFHRNRQGLAAVSLQEAVDCGRIHYVAMPETLVGRYQNFTEADLVRLRSVGYEEDFDDIETGINKYLS